ncbi:class I SAM-dependent methyltransferase [Aquimarina sp. 2201CG14-23]|uniref:class I SAM-dependent methyltransferase n=1 Tax=Aquimarina mycalae TaxID=3040073 RepID=UPI002477E6E7|nr:class I SAM-dependent methyltransferase [Aquimarina sp. 2201CG14-23]MDH7448059.1 class I SAM-dependent methyltransferase [Aquimarina sp. 2201CG14-23]
MSESFDIAAIAYDTTFTSSHIGKLQRDLVHQYVKKVLPVDQKLHILEINCGTGHDAIWLASQGHRVIATDISSEMISVAKTKQRSDHKDLEFRQLDINKLETFDTEHSFDLIFSDFGGLNCLSNSQLQTFFTSAEKKLKPNGKVVAVIMPKHCVIETFYFILKGKIKKAFRRNTNHAVVANVDGTPVNTWYYNPKNILKVSAKLYKVMNIKPIGFCIPPSYLEPFLKNNIGFLKVLSNLDAFFRRFSFLSKYSDHYVISLSKR